MKESKFVKVTLIILVVLLTVDISTKVLFNPSEATAAGKIQYKVVSLGSINSPSEYEELLNSMADQGWTFDHVLEIVTLVAFRK